MLYRNPESDPKTSNRKTSLFGKQDWANMGEAPADGRWSKIGGGRE